VEEVPVLFQRWRPARAYQLESLRQLPGRDHRPYHHRDIAAQPGPEGIAVLAGDHQLGRGQPEPGQLNGTGGGIRQPRMELAHHRGRVRVAATDPLLQLPGLVLQMLNVWVDGKLTYRHEGLLSAGRRPHVQAG
jgi:hypothetical protein